MVSDFGAATDNGFSRKVELIGVLAHPENNDWGPEDYPVSGAMGCFAEESSATIHRKHAVDEVPYIVGRGDKRRELDWDKTRELILKETSGRGHGAVLDQSAFVYSVDNLSRAATLFLCGPEYASHLQQSLRRATARRGFVLTSDTDGNKLMDAQFALYNEMKDAGVKTEDARIILPLNTKTAMQSMWNARELVHLQSMAQRMDVSGEVRDTVQQMYDAAYSVAPALMKDRGTNFEVLDKFPSSQLFARKNSVLERLANDEGGMQFLGFSKHLSMTADEIRRAVKGRDEALLSDLKHYHFEFAIPMSIMSFHQSTRQRTWNHAIETLANAVGRGKYVVPKTIVDAGFESRYRNLSERSIGYVANHLGDVELQGVVPHSLEVYDVIHVNGWNAIHSIGKRTCKTAQWEIREKAEYMADKIKEVAPEFGLYPAPQGVVYGNCPEREKCGYCFRDKGK